MEDLLKIESYKKPKYFFDLNLFALVDFEEPTVTDIIRLIIPSSKTEFEYIKVNRLTFTEDFKIELNGYTEFEIEDSFKSFSRVYYSNNNFIIILVIFPSRISTNLKSFRLLIQEIAPKIKPDKIYFKFCYKTIPMGTFQLLKKALRLEIESYKEMLKYNSYHIEYIEINTNSDKVSI